MRKNTKGLKFVRKNGSIFKISYSALSKMLAYQQNGKKDNEAGGVLIGRYIKDTENIVVDKVSVPQKNDKRFRFRFFKNKDEHQRIINKEWKKSKGTANYLGEWHTHPEAVPTASQTDIKTWKRQVKETQFEGAHLFFLIIGQAEVAAYEVEKKRNRISKMKLYVQ